MSPSGGHMLKRSITLLGVAATVATVATMGLVLAAPPPVPTKENPLRLTAFFMQDKSGQAGTIHIVIERWTTDAERKTLIDLVNKATDKSGGQEELLKALEKTDPRNGYIKTADSLGVDLKYAYTGKLPDGTRQIVLATEKPIGGLAAVQDARAMNFPFTFIEFRVPKGTEKGEGKLMLQTALSVKDGKLQIRKYGEEKTRLSVIIEGREKSKPADKSPEKSTDTPSEKK
jgi:hypothetical protein